MLIVADALRADHLGVMGYARDTSPHIDELAREGVLFRNLVAQSSHTVPSVAALLTGDYPGVLGIEYWPRTRGFSADAVGVPPTLPARVDTLAERLSASGFETAAVVANPWLRADYGFAQGYERYLVSGADGSALRYDGAGINDVAMEILRAERERGLFLYLHYLDTHNPYGRGHVPARYRTDGGREVYRNGRVPGLADVDLEFTRALYDEGIRYFDGLIGDLRARLDEEGLLDDTLIVLVSDHGDEFYEHGGLGHGKTLYNEVIRSFALFWSPRFAPVASDLPAQGIDVAPTILRLLGLASASDVAGRPLLDEGGRPIERVDAPRFSELGPIKTVVTGEWKLLVGPRGAERFFRVRPHLGLEAPVPAPERDVASVLRGEMARHVSRRRPEEPRAPTDIDGSTREALRALGYLEP